MGAEHRRSNAPLGGGRFVGIHGSGRTHDLSVSGGGENALEGVFNIRRERRKKMKAERLRQPRTGSSYENSYEGGPMWEGDLRRGHRGEKTPSKIGGVPTRNPRGNDDSSSGVQRRVLEKKPGGEKGGE